MIHRQFDQITIEDVEFLVSQGVPESRTLEYKEILPANAKDEEKKEFLADVVSFLNSDGGDIVFGIKEARDSSGKQTGLPEMIAGISDGVLNTDDAKLRIEQLINSGIEPRPSGYKIKFLMTSDQKQVCVLRAEESWNAPHMVTFRMRPAFHIRNNAGKSPMDISQIRLAFEESRSKIDRVFGFREKRLNEIERGITPTIMNAGPKLVLHMVPVQRGVNIPASDLTKLTRDIDSVLPIYARSSVRTRLNFDGLVSSVEVNQKVSNRTYLQIYRDGRLEAVSGSVFRPMPDFPKLLHYPTLEKNMIDAVSRYQSLYRNLSVLPPVVLMVSLIGVEGYYIVPIGRFGIDAEDAHKHSIDREDLILPEILVEDLSLPSEQILRPIFDMIWNACGYEHCHSYQDGKWTEPRN